jgi:hypothetical protein
MSNYVSDKQCKNRDLIAEAITQAGLSPEMSNEENIITPGPDLFADDLYVWNLLLFDRKNVATDNS